MPALVFWGREAFLLCLQQHFPLFVSFFVLLDQVRKAVTHVCC